METKRNEMLPFCPLRYQERLASLGNRDLNALGHDLNRLAVSRLNVLW